jgi:hypothetical protein
LAVLLALAGYLAVQYLTGSRGEPKCKVVAGNGDGESYEFTAEQAVNAATITAVGTLRGVPERAVTIALATSLQESALLNIAHGDRDSLGLFQQRPSQGWGTEKEILDPTYAADEFYEHLEKVPDYTKLPLTIAAQRVQRSGYPEAYAKHEPDATLLAAALTGRAAGTLTCEGRPSTAPDGPETVRSALVRDFGRDVLRKVGAEAVRHLTGLRLRLRIGIGIGIGGRSGRAVRLVHRREQPRRPADRDLDRPEGPRRAGRGAAAGLGPGALGRGQRVRAARRPGLVRGPGMDGGQHPERVARRRIGCAELHGRSPNRHRSVVRAVTRSGHDRRGISTTRRGFPPARPASPANPQNPLGTKGRSDSADFLTGRSLPGFLHSR